MAERERREQEGCPNCNATDREDRRPATSFGPAPYGPPCDHPWHGDSLQPDPEDREARREARSRALDELSQGEEGNTAREASDALNRLVEDREARCSCNPDYIREKWYADPNCPVHGRPERCPACGSDDPRRSYRPNTEDFCPDSWHLHGGD